MQRNTFNTISDKNDHYIKFHSNILKVYTISIPIQKILLNAIKTATTTKKQFSINTEHY